jgi:hypothetical protein
MMCSARQCFRIPVGFGQGFPSKERSDNTGASPNPLLTRIQQISNLFPRLKSALKGRRFCDDTETIKNATEELKMLSQNGFQECIQHLYNLCQKCIVPLGAYFEGNVA